MRRQLNTLYVTTEGAWLRKDGANIVMEVEKEIRARVALGALNHVTLVRSPEVRHPARLAQELARVLARYLGVPEAK